MDLNTKYGKVKIFARTLEEEALGQIVTLANSVLGEGANLRIMPDAHAGAGCVIGTTMRITDKVCPNLVGVDIGCGVDLVKTNIDFKSRLEELDNVIRKYIPYGKRHHEKVKTYREFARLKCWDKLKKETREVATKSLGSLGGGNHFIEAYDDGYLSVHSGSRNIGWRVAQYYQMQAEKQVSQRMTALKTEALKSIPENLRENWLKENKSKVAIDSDIAYLVDDLMFDYLHDMHIMQEFAIANRKEMLEIIVSKMNGRIIDQITSSHNYIDMNYNKAGIKMKNPAKYNQNLLDSREVLLRKGAISARKSEKLVIPLNMRDGLLLCEGKGNPDWNFSAPHGAGRLYSRSKAKSILSLEEYKKTMKGIFSTCINKDTLDEAPFAYKNYQEIMELIEPTVEIITRLIPIYNFKASE
ncbi:MAG: RtcB family protein [Erysipelotrichales bacterium]|nr:RtcB family protein [Erysipelotrichales bacterium]